MGDTEALVERAEAAMAEAGRLLRRAEDAARAAHAFVAASRASADELGTLAARARQAVAQSRAPREGRTE